MLKLPKQVLASPLAASVEALFTSTIGPLREGGQGLASGWRLTPKMRGALLAALPSGAIIQGLEFITKTLDRELKGLEAVQAKTEQTTNARLSRLLLLANDGSERFYHDAESLLHRHRERLWCCLLDVDSTQLGQVLKATTAKAILISDRKVLETFLLALVTETL